MRACSECSLCCKLLPVHGDLRRNGVNLPGNFTKPAGERCPHQRFKKGCAVYGKPAMPTACRMWNCRWLVNDDTADLARPDRSRYVLDIMFDFVTAVDNATGKQIDIKVVQVWCDPAEPDAWRDPALLAYLERRGREGIAALIRYGSKQAFTLFPPALSSDGQWHEVRNGTRMPEHTPAELLRKITADARRPASV